MRRQLLIRWPLLLTPEVFSTTLPTFTAIWSCLLIQPVPLLGLTCFVCRLLPSQPSGVFLPFCLIHRWDMHALYDLIWFHKSSGVFSSSDCSTVRLYRNCRLVWGLSVTRRHEKALHRTCCGRGYELVGIGWGICSSFSVLQAAMLASSEGWKREVTSNQATIITLYTLHSRLTST